MAVYTQIGSEDVASLLSLYDVGELVALKGIAEGVENSNYFIETTGGRYFLTIYESRVNPDDLPFYHSLLDHLYKAGCKVPRFINDRQGQWLQTLSGKPACLIEFLSGVSATVPTPQQAHACGGELAKLHLAVRDFGLERHNDFGVLHWRTLIAQCTEKGLDSIQTGLAKRVTDESIYLVEHWPRHLPTSIIHADLFPDNVLLLGEEVSGLIDFYFACSDVTSYDLAISHAAWSFSADGTNYMPQIGTAFIAGYKQISTLNHVGNIDFQTLARGACLRFLLTRCFDWINTPPDALVVRKDPLAYLRRLDFYCSNPDILGG
jgi:homoserine kinase type II